MDFTKVSMIHGVYISRYIASWLNEMGYLMGQDSDLFEEWLRTIICDDGKHLTDEEVKRICRFATCGKMELEHSARDFIKKKAESLL